MWCEFPATFKNNSDDNSSLDVGFPYLVSFSIHSEFTVCLSLCLLETQICSYFWIVFIYLYLYCIIVLYNTFGFLWHAWHFYFGYNVWHKLPQYWFQMFSSKYIQMIKNAVQLCNVWEFKFFIWGPLADIVPLQTGPNILNLSLVVSNNKKQAKSLPST